MIRIASAVDDQGKITSWDYHVYAAGERSSEVLYDVPNASAAFFRRNSSRSIFAFAGSAKR